MDEVQAKRLRAPFDPAHIGKLPRAGIQLDYVGHAVVTDRLLEVDPEWTWEPAAMTRDGIPLIEYGVKEATMWIRLTVCGVTRLGVGIVKVDAFELEKQLISDALRNAAMRFGVALDLWSKQDLHDTAHPPAPSPRSAPSGPVSLANVDALGPRDLNAALQAHGLPLGGTVQEMRDRLRDAAGEIDGSGDSVPSEQPPLDPPVEPEPSNNIEEPRGEAGDDGHPLVEGSEPANLAGNGSAVAASSEIDGEAGAPSAPASSVESKPACSICGSTKAGLDALDDGTYRCTIGPACAARQENNAAAERGAA